MVSIQEMKKLRDNIADSFGVSPSVAGRVIGYYNGNGRGDIVAAMVAGDLSGVGPALSALGENIPEKIGPAAGDDISTGDPVEKISTKTHASRKAQKNTSATCTASQDQYKSGVKYAVQDQLETVAGEIVTDETHDGLPVGVPDLIYSYIENFCSRENITDMRKERQTMWKALCMGIGSDIFKRSKYLHDVQKEKTIGGIYYDYTALTALCEFWAALCFKYGKAPTIDDFGRFAGVSDAFLYGTGAGYTDQQKATPARTALLKKLHNMQEHGLAALIVDGRQNPTGALAALNHWHGWTQTREIIHTAGQGSQTAAALPVFDAGVGTLPDKSTQ